MFSACTIIYKMHHAYEMQLRNDRLHTPKAISFARAKMKYFDNRMQTEQM